MPNPRKSPWNEQLWNVTLLPAASLPPASSPSSPDPSSGGSALKAPAILALRHDARELRAEAA